jgi:hypothetical protein
MNGYSTTGALDRLPDLLARLQNVVRQLNRPDIRTVSALIAKVIGDQNGGLMAVRLPHWFPRSKKAGGWVYKSWRDWNAECNLSQAQVKRVHGKGFLEVIGIERTIMKANGTPTVHYRLDEHKLIEKLAEFLDMMPLRIKMWMWVDAPNEDDQSCPSDQEDSDQFNELNRPDAFGEDEPTHSAESAQSITDTDSQTRQQTNDQSIQHNRYSVAVVDTESEEKKEILQALGKLGISYFKAKELIEKHGYKRVDKVIKHSEDQKRTNPAGYVIRALEDNWSFYCTPEKEDYACGNGLAHITGKYAAFINH